MGNLKVVVFGSAAAFLTAVVAKATEACPDLLAQWPSFLMAGVAAAVGLWMKSPPGVSGK